jgi:hypothetical protein
MAALIFPFRFNFEQARRQAKELHRSLRKNEVQAVGRLEEYHPEKLKAARTQLGVPPRKSISCGWSRAR